VTRWAWMALLLAAFAVSGLGWTLSGTWSAEISLLPLPALRSTELSLVYTTTRWNVASNSEFSFPWGWVWQEFNLGSSSPLAGLSGDVLFGPAIPDFLYAQIVGSMSLGGIEVKVRTAMIGAALGGPLGGAVGEVALPLGNARFQGILGFGASLPEDGFTIYHVSGLSKTYATDPRPGGFQFTEAKLSLTGLSLCCGINHDVTFLFTKAGFEYVEFVARNLPGFCCGISWDAAVRFAVNEKTIVLTPKWAGITGCLTVYGDVRFADHTWDGIEIYGWRVRCELGDCAYIESLTAFDVAKVEEILADEDLFQDDEFAYVKLGFCGPGCCGGRYAVDVAVYFVPAGALFGINRVTVGMEIPLGPGLTMRARFATPVLTLGWDLAF